MNMAAAMLQIDEGDRVRHRKDKCKSVNRLFFLKANGDKLRHSLIYRAKSRLNAVGTLIKFSLIYGTAVVPFIYGYELAAISRTARSFGSGFAH